MIVTVIYLISENIIFNPSDHTLACEKDDDFVKLSIPSSQLLEILILSKGELVTRDFLLSEIWDKNGLRGSNNNLNQYMSILRRTLISHGCDNLLITIPKIGFRLNPLVKIEPQAGNDDNRESNTSKENSQQEAAKKKIIIISLATLCIVAPLLILFAMKHFNTHYDIANSELSTLPSGCKVVYLHSFSEAEKRRSSVEIGKMIKTLSLPCGADKTLLFDNIDPIPDDTDYGKTFLSYCHNLANDTLGNCTDYYYSNWNDHHG